MARDQQHNPDSNVTAAKIVAGTEAREAIHPTDLETAWAGWSSNIQKVDERALSLLRAAFEAGYEAAQNR